MAKISTTLEINRPIDEVFEYLSNVDNAQEWSTGLVEVTRDGPIRLGATGTDVRMMGRKRLELPWTITVFEPHHRVLVEYTKPFPMSAGFTFEATEAGTQVSCETTMKPTGFWRLLVPLMARMAANTDRAQFEKAKQILEARAV
ncbi:MAG TPA: SRPBCC family protein [Acidimicrobiia bacterium]|nr:SRPBCC family protein [Acidimicrobiia bacterium]